MSEIRLENITKRWGKFVGVDNLNMVIEDRSFVTLLGPSGCGKTTTLRMIAGLETPTSGRIIIDGVTVFDSEQGINVPPSKRNVGFLFQNYALWPHMTVYQNIAFGLQNLKWDKQKINDRVHELLKLLKIEEFEKRYPSELSGGQQQRVAIARTLAPNPKILFMDEPLSNLDAKLRMEMRVELKRLHLNTDSTFVYVTHDQLEAMTLSSKVCIMEKGVLKQYAKPLEMYNKPSSVFVGDFIGNPTMNFIDAEYKDGSVEFCGLKAKFVSNEGIKLENKKVILGIRPEYIHISDKGENEGVIFSTLPSGMETTVKVSVNDNLLTSVVFGSVDYKVDEKVKIDFIGDSIILFDAETKDNIAMGRLEFGTTKSEAKVTNKETSKTVKKVVEKKETKKTTEKKTTKKKAE